MRKGYPFVLVGATLILSAIAYPRLPDRVPTHWNMHGQVNAYGPKWVSTLVFPAILLGLWGLLRFLPTIDPRRANYAKMQSTYDLVVNVVLTMVAAMHIVTVAAASGAPVAIPRLIPAIVGLGLVVLGNVLPRARPNWWFGIRTPWTLSNDRVWERTHRVGGYVLTAAGLLAIAAALFPLAIAGPVVGVLAGAASLTLVIYSYLAWKQETSR